MKNKKYSLKWKGKLYDCEWFEDTNFEDLDPIVGARGFVFNDNNEICLVKVSKEKKWTDLGGGIEDCDKTLEETFIREVEEEADIELKNLKRLGYIKAIERNKPETLHYLVRFVAKVKKRKPRTIDPAYNCITEIRFVKPEDFIKETGWNVDSFWQIKKAVKKIKEDD